MPDWRHEPNVTLTAGEWIIIMEYMCTAGKDNRTCGMCG
jgi:hypothetical protein